MSGVRRLVRLVGIALGVALLLAGAAQSSVADEGYDELAQFPGQGIPDPKVTGEWVTPQMRGITYLKRAKQWMQTPTLQAVALNRSTQQLNDPTCLRITQAPGAREYREWWADAVLVDRATALDSSRRYGYTQSFVVRTVAFGSVPVEATVALEQPRNARGVVIPATVKQGVALYCAGMGDFEIPPPGGAISRRYMPAEGEGRLRVRVDSVSIDGVALPLTGCRADRASLKLTSREYLKWDPNIPDEDHPGMSKEVILRTPYFGIEGGGLLFGTLDIPAFAGCVTSDGDDISALLTASVSGDGNSVHIRAEGTTRDPKDADKGAFEVCPFAGDCDDRFPAPELPTAPPS